jgi:hypothetical protein
MNIPSFSGSKVIVTTSSTPPTVTCPPPKDLIGGFAVGPSPPPPPPNPPPPTADSLGFGKGVLESPSYEPQTPAAGGDATVSGTWLEAPLEPSVEAVVKLLVVLTGSRIPLAGSLDVPFVFGGLES